MAVIAVKAMAPLPAYCPYYRAYLLQKEPKHGGTDDHPPGRAKTGKPHVFKRSAPVGRPKMPKLIAATSWSFSTRLPKQEPF